jgi:hypothetical protein
VHVILALVFTVEGRLPLRPHRTPAIIVLAPLAMGPADVSMRSVGGWVAGGLRGRDQGPGIEPRPLGLRQAAPSQGNRCRRRPEPADTPPPVPRRPPAIGLIGPGLAQGRLWVRPLPLPPKELAGRLSRKSHTQLVDSAVTAIVQAYLDSMGDPSSRRAGLPSWTTQIAGKKFGLDSSHIYLAGLKIPAAVLALLPIPAGNIDQNRAYNHLMEMRADLQYAAQRSQNLEEFKQMIRDMRLRKEREREFDENQRTAPPPQEPATP